MKIQANESAFNFFPESTNNINFYFKKPYQKCNTFNRIHLKIAKALFIVITILIKI
jgi:hypothetical protein